MHGNSHIFKGCYKNLIDKKLNSYSFHDSSEMTNDKFNTVYIIYELRYLTTPKHILFKTLHHRMAI